MTDGLTDRAGGGFRAPCFARAPEGCVSRGGGVGLVVVGLEECVLCLTERWIKGGEEVALTT